MKKKVSTEKAMTTYVQETVKAMKEHIEKTEATYGITLRFKSASYEEALNYNKEKQTVFTLNCTDENGEEYRSYLVPPILFINLFENADKKAFVEKLHEAIANMD